MSGICSLTFKRSFRIVYQTLNDFELSARFTVLLRYYIIMRPSRLGGRIMHCSVCPSVTCRLVTQKWTAASSKFSTGGIIFAALGRLGPLFYRQRLSTAVSLTFHQTSSTQDPAICGKLGWSRLAPCTELGRACRWVVICVLKEGPYVFVCGDLGWGRITLIVQTLYVNQR